MGNCCSKRQEHTETGNCRLPFDLVTFASSRYFQENNSSCNNNHIVEKSRSAAEVSRSYWEFSNVSSKSRLTDPNFGEVLSAPAIDNERAAISLASSSFAKKHPLKSSRERKHCKNKLGFLVNNKQKFEEDKKSKTCNYSGSNYKIDKPSKSSSKLKIQNNVSTPTESEQHQSSMRSSSTKNNKILESKEEIMDKRINSLAHRLDNVIEALKGANILCEEWQDPAPSADEDRNQSA
ncbi:unnamed protein product [Moneuplotes crassus]|uniref:Uncharacterized protein n=1 Tax=Euplotes crassus TaxID=5936 RepID=A0AAD2D425_EUPCR|nr:unnamed protein product [Moneuplotes crassus]